MYFIKQLYVKQKSHLYLSMKTTLHKYKLHFLEESNKKLFGTLLINEINNQVQSIPPCCIDFTRIFSNPHVNNKLLKFISCTVVQTR